jgi:NitT/TauT family transport system substrate-binding protein
MPTAIVDVDLFSIKFLEENPGAVEAYVQGIFKAQEFLETNRDEALAIAGRRLQLIPEELAEQLKGVDLTSLEKNVEMLGNPQSDIYLVKHMNSLGQFLAAQKQIPKAPNNLAKLLEPQFVKLVQHEFDEVRRS